ncbi:hypothetical protein EDD11_010606 [Mortierella claussenii]|nr:hypothetical protein EDD11_010606 [Mortierella claussenii]
MPRTKLSSTNATTSATLNDLAHPYPTPSTSPLLVPTLPPPPSPLSALTAPIVTLKAPNQQHVLDSTLSLPVGTTLNIPRKNGSSRIGQSILGQLLASHKPGRDHHKLASDAALSLETIRPKEQQRRSILPASWTMSFQKSTTRMHGLSLDPASVPALHQQQHVARGKVNSIRHHGMENKEPSEQQHQHPVLPSVWLESVLSRLSRSDMLTPPHYATLPRISLQESTPPSLRPIFSDLESSRKDSTAAARDEKRTGNLKPASSRSSNSSHDKGLASPGPKSATLSRRGSACELALGDDAHELFHQNRPKTLSSAVISSSIVPAKESLRNVRQRSLDSSVSATKPVTTLAVPGNLPKSSTESCPPLGTTTKTTRGRFTIESSSSAPNPFRTRTLSCTGATPSPMLVHQQQQKSVVERSTLSVSPPPSISANRPLSYSAPRSSNASTPSSPSFPLSTSSDLSVSSVSHDVLYTNSNSYNNSTSNPISIPRTTKPNHQRTHSNSSIQSSTSTSSRRSQIIIPPPASSSSLQFASFSSISSPNGVLTGATASPHVHPQHSIPPRRSTPNNSANCNIITKSDNNSNSHNFRNLSIQIVGGGDVSGDDAGQDNQDSRDSQVFHLETLTVHPLDKDAARSPASTSSAAPDEDFRGAHQTMNRVHPRQDSIDNPTDCHGPLATCSTSCSSVSSLGSSLGNYGRGGQHQQQQSQQSHFGADHGFFYQGYHDRNGSSGTAGYFRQRSLSATNVDSRTGSSSAQRYHQQPELLHHHVGGHPTPLQQTKQGSLWNEMSTRRTHGSVSNADHHLHHRSDGTPPAKSGGSMSSSYSGTGSSFPLSSSSTLSSGSSSSTPQSDIVMVKKSATGRMFTVERAIPPSPTKCSRFIVVSSTDELCVPITGDSLSPSPPRSSTPLQD